MKKWILSSILIAGLATTVASIPAPEQEIQTTLRSVDYSQRALFDLSGIETVFDKEYIDSKEGINITAYIEGTTNGESYEILDSNNSVKLTGVVNPINGEMLINGNSKLEFNEQYIFKIKYGANKYQSLTFRTMVQPDIFKLTPYAAEAGINSIQKKYNWIQASDNAYKNTQVKIDLLKDSTVIDTKYFDTKGLSGGFTYEINTLDESSDYSIQTYVNNNKGNNIWTLIETENVSTLDNKFIFDGNITFKGPFFNKVEGQLEWSNNLGVKVESIVFELTDKSDTSTPVIISDRVQIGGMEEGVAEFSFGSLKYGNEYEVRARYTTVDGKDSNNDSAIQWTKNKTIPVKTNIEAIDTKESLELDYKWSDNFKGSEYIQVESSELEIANLNTGETFDFNAMDKNSSESGNIIIDLDEDDVFPGTTYQVSETINFVQEQNEKEITNNYSFTVDYFDPFIKNINATTDGTSANININIEEASMFEKDLDNKLSIKFLSGTKPCNVFFNNEHNSEFELDYDQLVELDNSSTISNDEISFNAKINGIPWNGAPLEVMTSIGQSSKSTVINFDSNSTYAINPDSLLLEETKVNSFGDINYKISLEDNDVNRDLENGIEISEINGVDTDNKIQVMNHAEAQYAFGDKYEDGYLYLTNTNNDASKDLDFLLNRFIKIEKASHRSAPSEFNLFYISEFPSKPFPMWTLGLIIPAIIIPIILLIIFIFWYTNRRRWAKYVEEENGRVKEELKMQYNNFGWNQKFDEYIALNEMSTKELNKYAKSLELELPKGIKREEKVDILSLLNEVELKRVKSFLEYEIEVTDKEIENLEQRYIKDSNNPLWMRFLLSRTIRKSSTEKKTKPNKKKSKGGDHDE